MTTTEADGASEEARELVKRLRDSSINAGSGRMPHDAYCAESAEAQAALLTYIASLEAENERLREALDELDAIADDQEGQWGAGIHYATGYIEETCAFDSDNL